MLPRNLFCQLEALRLLLRPLTCIVTVVLYSATDQAARGRHIYVCDYTYMYTQHECAGQATNKKVCHSHSHSCNASEIAPEFRTADQDECKKSKQLDV